ncbi:hypothetical protein [Labrys neptuniae]
MTAVQFHHIDLSYCNAREDRQGARLPRTSGRRRLVGLFGFSDHLLRDIGVLDGQPVRGRPTEAAASAYDLMDRYR